MVMVYQNRFSGIPDELSSCDVSSLLFVSIQFHIHCMKPQGKLSSDWFLHGHVLMTSYTLPLTESESFGWGQNRFLCGSLQHSLPKVLEEVPDAIVRGS